MRDPSGVVDEGRIADAAVCGGAEDSSILQLG